jgi:hypothetical protein
VTAGGAWVRRHRSVLAIVAVVLATVSALSVVAARSAGRGADLDPQNPGANGARAVAEVLRAQGVEVSVVRRAGALDRARVDRGTTVVVTSTANLGRVTARRLGRRAASAGATVLVAPGPALLRALRLPVRAVSQQYAHHADAACTDPLLGGLAVDPGWALDYRVTTSADGAVSCFPSGRRTATVARVEGPPRTYVVGADGMLSNRRITRADNAAAALRLLGQRGRLVWYVPDVRDVPVGDAGSVSAQLPRGLVPALWLVVASVLATMLWRGRRLGRLVVEPLPVRVRAVESTQGRGRLYRKVRDREHAAEALRAATARRLAAHLRLPPRTNPEELSRAVAATTGADPRRVDDVLTARRVSDDAALTRLAADLAALEREVHQP